MAKRISAFSLVSLLHWLTQILGWLLGTVLAVVFIAVLWLTASESGARWAVGQAESFVPELSVGSVSGSLWGGLILKDIHYAETQPDGLKAEVGLVELGLAWWPFWRAEIKLQPVTVVDARIALPAAAEDAPPPEPTDTDPLAVFEQDWQLPVRISLPSVVISDLTLMVDSQQIDLHHLHLSAFVAGADATLNLYQLNLQTDQAQVSADGAVALGLDPAHHLDANLNFLVNAEGNRLDGRVAIAGALPQVEIRPEIAINPVDLPPVYAYGRVEASPEQVVLDRLTLNILDGVLCTGGQLDLVDGLSGQFDVQATELNPGCFDPQFDGTLSFKLDGRFDLSLEQPMVEVRLDQFSGSVAGEQIEQISGLIKLADNHLNVDLKAHFADGRFDLNADLGLDAHSPVSVDLEARQAQLAPFVLPVLLGVDELRPLLAETPRDLSLLLDADLSIQGSMPDTTQPLETLPAFEMALKKFSLDVAGLAEGIDAFAVQTGFDLRSADEQLALSDWFIELPGLAMNADIQANLTALLADIAGDEQDKPEIPPWQQTPVQIDLDFSVPEIAALPWAMITPFAPELDAFATPTGAVNLNLAVSGDALAPVGSGQLQLSGFHGFDARVDRAVFEFQAQGLEQAELVFDISEVEYAQQRHLDRARLRLEGGLAHLTARLSAQSPHADAEFALEGGLIDERFTGHITRLWLAVPEIAELETTQPAAFAADGDAQQIENFCLAPRKLGPNAIAASADVGQLCVSASHQAGAVNARARGDWLLADLLAMTGLPDFAQIEAPGRLFLNVDASLDAAGVPDVQASLSLPANEVRFKNESFPDLAYQDFNVDASLKNQQLKAQAQGGLVGYFSFALDGDYHLESEQFNAEFQLAGIEEQAVSLAALVRLTEEILGTAIGPVDEVSGWLSAQIHASGNIDSPVFDGEILLEELAFDSLETGTAYHDGRILLTLTEDGSVSLDGGLSGKAQTPDVPVFEPNRVRTRASAPTEGRLTLTGSGSIADLTDWYFDLHVAGEAIPVLRLPVLALDARPDLQIHARSDGASVRGVVHVPLAIAQVADLPQSAVTSSSDLVIEGQTVEEPVSPYALTGDIDLLLGDEISLRGLGFASRVAGELKVILRPDDPLSLVGEISLVDGRYSALGQTLKVETGRLIFAGPPGDPGLDVSAIRELHDADDTVAGLKITGSLTEPVAEVFSRPPTSQSDALSMLLTGRRLGQGGSSDEGALLMNAITGLGLRGGDTLAQQVGSAFGFDEFGIDTDNGLAGTRLSVGRQITDNLLVRYAIGVFDGVGELITRYRINRALSIEVITSPESQGGDVIYQFDRD